MESAVYQTGSSGTPSRTMGALARTARAAAALSAAGDWAASTRAQARHANRPGSTVRIGAEAAAPGGPATGRPNVTTPEALEDRRGQPEARRCDHGRGGHDARGGRRPRPPRRPAVPNLALRVRMVSHARPARPPRGTARRGIPVRPAAPPSRDAVVGS